MDDQRRPMRSFISASAISLSVVTLLSGNLPGWADKQPMPYPGLKTASGVSRFFQGMTGFTPISGWMANRMLKRELAKYIQGDLQSRLTLFSGSDLLNGKAKRIEFSGKKVLLDDFIPLSEFHLESATESPVYVSKSKRPILLNPMRFQVNARMTEADINQLLNSDKGKKLLTDMKVNIPPFGSQHLDVVNPSVQLDGDRLILSSVMNKHDQPIENGLPISVSGKLAAKDARLNLTDLDLKIEGFEDTEEIEQLVENYFSELVNLNHIKVDRHRIKIAIEQSDVIDHQLFLQASVKIEPERKALEKYIAGQQKKVRPH